MGVVIAEPDPDWPRAFEREAERLGQALGPDGVTLHHIGSTAVPSLAAKPIIDILGVVDALNLIDAAEATMRDLGYEVMGAYGIEGRRYFRRSGADGRRLFHLHVFATGAADITRHLALRDYLRAQPQRAADYAALKRRLAAEPDYQAAKVDFVAELTAEALAWRSPTG